MKPSLSQKSGLASAAVAALFIFYAPTAHADTTAAADLDFDTPVSSHFPADAKSGGGFGIRLGQQFHVPLLVVNPEIGFTYASFSHDETPKVYRGIVGVRLGVGEILRPGVFAHVGIGHLDLSPPSYVPDASHNGFTYDAGIFLDFTAIPFLNIGIHGAYNNLASSDSVRSFQWINLGAHAALVF